MSLCGVEGCVCVCVCVSHIYTLDTLNGFHENYKKIMLVMNKKSADSPTARDNDMENARTCQERTTFVFLALALILLTWRIG